MSRPGPLETHMGGPMTRSYPDSENGRPDLSEASRI